MSYFAAPARASGDPWHRARLPVQPSWAPRVPRAAVAAVAFLLAVAVGRFLADGRTSYAAALVIGACYAPIVLLNLPLAFAVYVAILFVQDIPALSVAPNSIGVLVLLGWLGTFISRSARTGVLREHSRLLLALALFGLWLSLSILWATSSYDAGNGVQNWLTAMLAFIVAITTLKDARQIRLIAAAFIVGAVASVAYGIADGALSAAAHARESALEGRFTGGGGDPNVQAAGFLVAMFLCAGLWSLARSRTARLSLLAAFTCVAVGFFATESRGGLISLGFAAVSGFVLMPRQRKRLLGLAASAAVGFAAIAAASPSAVSRITDFGGGTSGRSDLWTVAWRIFSDHPWLGVGISNFQVLEPRYTLRSGTLARVELIAEDPHYVHNVYLQLLTETGVIGFALFLILIVGCMRASWLASRRFDAIGRLAYGDLARAVLLGEIAMMSALFFISDGEDWRLWILLGLGPAMLSLARRTAPALRPRPTRSPARAQPRVAATRSS
jgi:O-antigen ligase